MWSWRRMRRLLDHRKRRKLPILTIITNPTCLTNWRAGLTTPTRRRNGRLMRRIYRPSRTLHFRISHCPSLINPREMKKCHPLRCRKRINRKWWCGKAPWLSCPPPNRSSKIVRWVLRTYMPLRKGPARIQIATSECNSCLAPQKILQSSLPLKFLILEEC